MKTEFESIISEILGQDWGYVKKDKLILGRQLNGKRCKVRGGCIIYRGELSLREISLIRKLISLFHKAEELQRSSTALQKVTEVAEKLSLSVGWKQTLTDVLRTIRSILPGEFLSIYLVNRKRKEIFSLLSKGYKREEKKHLHLKFGKGLVGWSIMHGKPIIIGDVRDEPRYYKVKEETRAEIVVPIRVGERIIGAINIEDTKENSFTEKERRVLEVFASIAGIVIERARLYSSFVDHKLTLKELEVARRIQFHFLPSRFPKFKDFKIYGRTIPAHKVGGDYFNFKLKGKDNLLVVIADVSGKGIPASLLMSFFHSALMIYSKETSLEKLVKCLNAFFLSQTEDNQFITGIIGYLKKKEKIFEYVNFGHHYPIIIKDGKAEQKEGSDIVLGVVKDPVYTVKKINLKEYQAVYLFTDGAVEQRCGRNEFGVKRLIRIIEEHWEKPSKAMDALLRKMEKQCGEERDDDLTMVGIVKNVGN